MLYLQLTQVLLRKPKRGHTFCGIVTYSSLLFPLATLAIVGMFKFDERSYIDNRNYPGGSIAFRQAYMSDAFNVMCQFWSVITPSESAELIYDRLCSVTLFPWLADLLMVWVDEKISTLRSTDACLALPYHGCMELPMVDNNFAISDIFCEAW